MPVPPDVVATPYEDASADDLADQGKPPRWLVDRLFALGGQYIMAGPPKRGMKSLLSFWLAHCISSGFPFLGMPTLRYPVLYVALEGGKQLAAWRWKQIGRGTTGRSDLDRSALLTRIGGIDAWHRTLEELREPRLVIVDNLSRVTAGAGIDENDPAQVTNLLGQCESLLHVDDLSVLLWLHHFRKAADRMRGSTALEAAPDGWLEHHATDDLDTIRIEATLRRARSRVLGARLVEENGRLRFESVEPPARRDPMARSVRNSAPNGASATADVDILREFFYKYPGPHAKRAVWEAMKDSIGARAPSKHRVENALEVLEEHGEVAATGPKRALEATDKLTNLMIARANTLATTDAPPD